MKNYITNRVKNNLKTIYILYTIYNINLIFNKINLNVTLNYVNIYTVLYINS